MSDEIVWCSICRNCHSSGFPCDAPREPIELAAPPGSAVLEDIASGINEYLTQAEMWSEHYKIDPDGAKDAAFWEGQARATSMCLALVRSHLSQT